MVKIVISSIGVAKRQPFLEVAVNSFYHTFCILTINFILFPGMIGVHIVPVPGHGLPFTFWCNLMEKQKDWF